MWTVAAAALFIGCAKDAPMSIRVEPATAEVAVLTELPFVALVSGTLGTAIDWSIEPLDGLSVSAAGAISQDGVYTAPERVPGSAVNQVVVRARSRRAPEVTATAVLHIVPPPIEPRSGPSTGAFAVRIRGEGFTEPLPQVFFGLERAKVLPSSPLELLVEAPPHVVETVDVRIVYSDGREVVYPRSFRYGAGTLMFSGVESIPGCSSSNEAIRSAQLDGCGGEDLVIRCEEDEIIILRNQSDHYEAPLATHSGEPFIDLQLLDVTGDGDADLVGVSYSGIHVFPNPGSSTCGNWNGFGDAIVTTTAPTYMTSFVAADVDSDGVVDLVGRDRFDAMIFWGLSGGTFEPVALELPVVDPMSVAVGDFDGDARQDVAVGSAVTGGGAIVIFEGGAARSFVPVVVDDPFGVGSYAPDAFPLATMNLDGLGADELVYGESFESHYQNSFPGVRVLSWTGATFGYQPDFMPFYGARANPMTFRTGDFDRDGVMDLIVQHSYFMTIHYGADPEQPTPFLTPTDFVDGAITELAPGSREDFVAISALDPAVRVLRNGGPGVSSVGGVAPLDLLIPRGYGFTGTSNLVTDPVSNELRFVYGSAGGGVNPNLVYDVALTPEAGGVSLALQDIRIGASHLADIRKDGRLDLVVVNWDSRGVTYFEGTSTGYSAPRELIAAGDSLPYSLATADLDGDGFLDVVVGSVSQAPAIRIVPGADEGPDAATVDLDAPGLAYSVRVADLNADGATDLVYGDHQADEVHVVYNNTGASNWLDRFGATATLPLDGEVLDVVAGDLDGDERSEIIVSSIVYFGSEELFELTVYTDLGLGYEESGRYRFPFGVPRVRIADVDSDGHLDLLGPCSGTGDVMLIRGSASGELRDPEFFFVGSGFSEMYVIDLDKDGRDDVLGVSPVRGAFRLFNRSH